MTLRNEIEQAIDDFAREYKNLSPSSDAWEQYRAMTDRAVTKVCDAISKTAQGMPKRPTILIHTSNDRFVVPTLETRKQLQQIEDAEKEYLTECQAYWQKELK